MPKSYVNLKQIARFDFLMNCTTIKLINTCSKPFTEITVFTIKNIEFKFKILVNC